MTRRNQNAPTRNTTRIVIEAITAPAAAPRSYREGTGAGAKKSRQSDHLSIFVVHQGGEGGGMRVELTSRVQDARMIQRVSVRYKEDDGE